MNTNGSAFSEDLIRAELARLLESPIFALSDRLGRFLRFAVEHAISGSEDGLKEYVIGTEVYDRKPPYHPSQDSIVRTEARRLRIKLKEYYESEGKDDPIFIYFRPGSYIPVFRPRAAAYSQEIGTGNSEEQVFVEGAGIPVAVLPFLDASGQPLSSEFARGVTDELVHGLTQCEGVRVVSTSSIGQLGSQAQDISSLAQRLGVRIIFEGSVRLEGARVRVTSRMVSADGFQLWSQRFDAEAAPSSFFEVQEQFASAVVNRVRPRQSIIRNGEASAGPVVLSLYPSLLKAEVWLEEGNESDVQCALAKFREIAQAVKGYARPLYGVAHCYCWTTLHGHRLPPAWSLSPEKPRSRQWKSIRNRAKLLRQKASSRLLNGIGLERKRLSGSLRNGAFVPAALASSPCFSLFWGASMTLGLTLIKRSRLIHFLICRKWLVRSSFISAAATRRLSKYSRSRLSMDRCLQTSNCTWL